VSEGVSELVLPLLLLLLLLVLLVLLLLLLLLLLSLVLSSLGIVASLAHGMYPSTSLMLTQGKPSSSSSSPKDEGKMSQSKKRVSLVNEWVRVSERVSE
jgi:hypothetical protein